MTDKCMKYYYPEESDIQELNLPCLPRNFRKINDTKFTNENLLNFIDDNYSKFENILFKGRLSGKALLKEFELAHVLVLASNNEN